MKIVFHFGDEMLIVKVLGQNILFSNSTTNFTQYAPIEGIGLKKEGILKLFPDLEGLEPGEMRVEAIKRFKEHIKSLATQDKIKEYIINEFISMGYTLKMVLREGFRPTKS